MVYIRELEASLLDALLKQKMKIFKRKRKTVGQKDPEGRRQLLKASGIGAATLFVNKILPGTALAMSRSPHYERPIVVKLEPDQALRNAWDYFHDSKLNSGVNLSLKQLTSEEYGAALLRMADHGCLYEPPVTDETINTSFVYRLLVAKVGPRYGNVPRNAPADNYTLNYYTHGVLCLFMGGRRDPEARDNFAKGIFTAAKLDEKDFKTLQSLGFNVTYDKQATIEGNGLKLAETFVKAKDVLHKERMLRVIADKFSGISFNHDNNDWNSDSYRLKAIYWNLGFYITSEFSLENNTLADSMRNDHSLSYRAIRKLMGVDYNTANGDLLRT